jgi:hypothetical protein
MSTLVQSIILNVQNSIHRSTLPDVSRKQTIIPHVFVPLMRNVMEKNPIGFSNSMYLHVGPYTPYFGFEYGSIGSAPTMWPPMSNPLPNFISPPKPILGIAQVGIV